MRRLGDLLLVGVIFTVCLCSVAAACVPAEEAIKRHGPVFSEVLTFDGRDARPAGDLFNAIPPLSDEAWNFAILASLKAGGGMLLVGKEHAVCAGIQISPQQWDTVLRSIVGVGA